jgi:hypothetical protein
MKNTQNQFFNIIYDTDKNWMIKNLINLIIKKNRFATRFSLLEFCDDENSGNFSKFPKFKVFILGKFPISNFY